MPLQRHPAKTAEGESPVEQPVSEPAAEVAPQAPVKPPVPEVPAVEPQAEKSPEPAPAPAPAKSKNEETRPVKHLLTKRGRIRDPFTLIMFNTNTPTPTPITSWIKCQIDAGVLVIYDKPIPGVK